MIVHTTRSIFYDNCMYRPVDDKIELPDDYALLLRSTPDEPYPGEPVVLKWPDPENPVMGRGFAEPLSRVTGVQRKQQDRAVSSAALKLAELDEAQKELAKQREQNAELVKKLEEMQAQKK